MAKIPTPERFDAFYGRWWRRVSGKWTLRSHHVWKQHTGKDVPTGHILHHKDENPQNDVFENLQVMTRAEHARHHGIGRVNSDEVKAQMSKSAKARCTEEWRMDVRARATAQMQKGTGLATPGAMEKAWATQTKFSDETIRAVRADLAEGKMLQGEIAMKYGISTSYISAINLRTNRNGA